VGGKNKNRHADKKNPAGRGNTDDKTIVFGARGLLGEVRTEVIPNCEADTLKPIVDKWVEKGSIMVTDEHRSYNALKEDYFHVSVNHKDGQYASGAFSSNGIENFWSLFKRGIIGTWHNISPQHIQRYADEFSFRYNQKGKESDVLFNAAVRNCANARITYKELTKGLFTKQS
jgi:transposase-like protein